MAHTQPDPNERVLDLAEQHARAAEEFAKKALSIAERQAQQADQSTRSAKRAVLLSIVAIGINLLTALATVGAPLIADGLSSRKTSLVAIDSLQQVAFTSIMLVNRTTACYKSVVAGRPEAGRLCKDDVALQMRDKEDDQRPQSAAIYEIRVQQKRLRQLMSDFFDEAYIEGKPAGTEPRKLFLAAALLRQQHVLAYVTNVRDKLADLPPTFCPIRPGPLGEAPSIAGIDCKIPGVKWRVFRGDAEVK